MLTEEQVVAAAVRLCAGRPVEDLSMRALAKELGVPVMTLYNYAPSKTALVQLVLNHILRDVEVPGPDDGTWEERLVQLERNARRVLLAHGGLSLSRYGSELVEAARLAEGALSILRSGGFDDEQAARAFTALYTFVIGQVEVDTIRASLGGHAEQTLEDVSRQTPFSPDDLFEFGLIALLDGLKARLLKPPPTRRTGRRG